MDLNEQMELARQHYDAGRMADCALVVDYILRRDPNHWQALLVSGQMSFNAQLHGQAIQSFLKASQLEPKNIYAWKMLGHLLTVEGHQMAGIKAFEEACKFEPQKAENWVNLAAAFVNMGMPDRVIDAANMALHREPGNCGAEYHKALGLMEKGEWDKGLPLYERRLEMPEAEKARRPYNFPIWDGKPVRRLLLAGEQGLGDEILFLGWLKDIPADEIALEVTPRLVKTVKRSFPEATVVSTAEEVIGRSDTIVIGGGEQSMSSENRTGGMEPFDAWAHLGSLMLHRGVENRWRSCYMKPDAERVAFYRSELAKLGPAPYVGLSWSGGRISTHGFLRNAHSDFWKPLTQAATCISVQYGPSGTRQAQSLLGLEHWQGAIDDIDELFALLSALDLVITVNNSTAHMCGALGKDCWTLTPSRPAWRYQLSGEKMPWYDTVKQYRQVGDEWGPVFVRVAGDLAKFANRREAA